MFSMFQRLRRKLFRPVPQRKAPQQPSFVPRLEPLEDRLLLDAMLFNAAGGAWNVAANWNDLSNPAYIHVPNPHFSPEGF